MAHLHYYPISETAGGALHMDPSLVYTGRVANVPQWHSAMHSHNFCELLFVAEGEMDFILEDGACPAKRGDLILCNPRLPHAEQATGDALLRLEFFAALGFQFTGLQPDFLLPAGACPVLPCSGFSRQIAALFTELLSETQKNQPYSALIAQGIAINILSLSRRIYASNQPQPDASEKVLLAKQFIDENFTDPLSLDQLAELFNISKYYLSHRFKDQIGISPMRYLTLRRIHHACQLLKDPSLTMETIAERCGYTDPQYFRRLFRRTLDCTPGQYRREQQSSAAELEPVLFLEEKPQN